MKLQLNKIYQGDCIEVMKTMPDNSVDTIITDPPYGIGFMGKEWDNFKPSKINEAMARDKRPHTKIASQRRSNTAGTYDFSPKGLNGFQEWMTEVAKELLRVTKPGGTMMIFGGTRTYHRMACAIEDAGWVIKDCIMWLYGSGFPKATDISKQIDRKGGRPTLIYEVAKALKEAREKRGITKSQADKIFCGGTTLYSWYEGRPKGIQLPTSEYMKKIAAEWKELEKYVGLTMEAEREIIGHQKTNLTVMQNIGKENISGDVNITKAETPEAKLWNGWKSHGLKPAYEPIIVAVKPNEGTYANNAMKWGVSGLNIDGGRIEHNEPIKKTKRTIKGHGTALHFNTKEGGKNWKLGDMATPSPKGRFPANIILDEEAAKMLDEQSGEIKSGARKETINKPENWNAVGIKFEKSFPCNASKGGASRFFYAAKASKSERNLGCEGLEEKKVSDGREKEADNAYQRGKTLRTNTHPTVKPLKLMEYLCTLTKTPTGGIVLDPFAGSGTTCLAAKKTGRDFIGIEKEEEYVKIAEARIRAIQVPLL